MESFGCIILELPTVRLWNYNTHTNTNTVSNQVGSKEVTQLHTVSILRHVIRRPFSSITITFLCIQGRASGTPSETVYRGMGESNLRYVLLCSHVDGPLDSIVVGAVLERVTNAATNNSQYVRWQYCMSAVLY